MPIERQASCRCGALTAICSGEPARVSICHCMVCRRRTGSAFSWNATYPEDQVQLSGERHVYTRTSDEGNYVRYNFCPTCGNTVTFALEVRPGMISLPVGAFADADFPPPDFEVFAERRSRWCLFALPGVQQQ